MNILVTGSAGYIGGKLVKALCQKDWVESVVGTDIEDPGFEHPKYIFKARDIRESLDDIFKVRRITSVVHSAYVVPPIHNKRLMEDINKGGAKNILSAAVRSGVRQFLYTSSTTAYGFYVDNDDPLTEESPLRGNDDFTYAKNKKEIEAILEEFKLAHPEMLITTVRPCFVIGPGLDNPLSRHLQKTLVMLPSKTRPFQFVHEDDLTDVLTILLEECVPGTYNVTGEATITFPEMIAMLGNIRIPVPWPIMYVLNNLAWHLRLSFVTEFPSPALLLTVHPWIASSKKLHEAIDCQFKYDSRSAFEDFARSITD